MSSKRQTTRAGAFVITEEPGSISRDSGYLAEGDNLEAGTLLAENDDGDLVAWESGDCAGILFAGTDASSSRQRVTTIARMASVNFELLNFGDAEEADARDALEALRIVVISDHALSAGGGGGGGDETVAEILLQNSSDASLSMPEVGAVTGVVDIEFNDNLETISLPFLTTVGDDFTILHHIALTSVDLSSLVAVGNHFNFQDNYVLPELDCSALRTVTGEFALQGANAMTSLLLPALETCVNFSVFDAPVLTELNLPSLTSVGEFGNLGCHTNAAMTSMSATAITTIYTLNIYENDLLATFDLSNASTINNINIHDNAALTEISLPALTYTEYLEGIHDNPSVTSISLPALLDVAFSGIALTTGMAAVTSLALGSSLRRVDGNVVLTSCALTEASVDDVLVRLAALDGTAGTTSLDGKTVTITGTSAPPSATGLAAKATLEGRGNTVTVNS